MNSYYYVYVRQSESDQNYYTGFSRDIRKRIRELRCELITYETESEDED